jgi:flagellar biosynthesis/type III secretory pathway protein FliH
MMSTFATTGILFEEDFDLPPQPPPAPEPEVIEPVFTDADLEAARAQAWQEGHDAASAAADAATTTRARIALARIAEEIAAARHDASALAEQAAASIAQLLLDCFAAAFPALCAHHGQAEVLAIIRAVVPTLHLQPAITVRVSPHLAGAIAQEVEQLDPDFGDRVQIVPTDAVPLSDIRISWRNGGALRDTAGLWSEITAVLGANGLFPASEAKELAYAE